MLPTVVIQRLRVYSEVPLYEMSEAPLYEMSAVNLYEMGEALSTKASGIYDSAIRVWN